MRPTSLREACSKVTGFWLGPKAAARGYRLNGFETIGSTNSEAVKAAQAGDVGDVWYAPCSRPPVAVAAAASGTPRRATSRRACSSFPKRIRPSPRPLVSSPVSRSTGHCSRSCPPRVSRLASMAPRAGRSASRSNGPMTCLADGAKLAGILLEAQKRPDGGHGRSDRHRVSTVVSAPEGLPYPATSLRRSAATCGRNHLRGAERRLGRCIEILGRWPRHRRRPDALAHCRCRYRRPKSRSAAMATWCAAFSKRIDEAGRLIVRANDNRRVAITAGDVHFGATASVRT